jgi:hypothetical protein
MVELNGGQFHHAFQCRGCGQLHAINNGWTWNGDVERPTITPSILVRGTKITDKGWEEIDAWKASGSPKRDEPFDSIPTICHSFVTDGQIQFLSDCTHALAGQTVPLEDI